MDEWYSVVGSNMMARTADPVSWFFCWTSVLPYLGFMALVSVAVYSADPRYCRAVTGTLIAVVACEVLKRVIKQPRPAPSWPHADKLGYGMPSQHSCTGFALAMLFAACFASWRPRSLLAVALACLQAWGRVANEYHTVEQVAAGSVLGVLIALALTQVKAGRKLLTLATSPLSWAVRLAHEIL